MYIYICIYIRVCISVFVYIYLPELGARRRDEQQFVVERRGCIYIYIYIYEHMHMHIHIYIYIYLHICMFLNVYICVRLYLPELGARRQDKQQFVVERSRVVAGRKRNFQQSAHDS